MNLRMKNYEVNNKLNSLFAAILTYFLCSCQSSIQNQETTNKDTLFQNTIKKDSLNTENITSTIHSIDTSQYAQFVKKFKPLKLPLQFSFDEDVVIEYGRHPRIKDQEIIQFICEAPNECFYARNFQLTTYHYVGRLNISAKTDFLVYHDIHYLV